MKSAPWLLSAALHAALGAAAWVTVAGMPDGEAAGGLSPDTDATYEIAIRPGGSPTIGDTPRLADSAHRAPQDSATIENTPPASVPELANVTVPGPRLVTGARPGTGLPARNYARGPVAVFPRSGGGGGPGKGTGEGTGEGVEAVPLETPPPAYPLEARRGNMEGVVIAEIRIDSQGRVESARASQSSGSALLDDAAIAAVRGWRYRPATLRGAPVPSVRRVRFEFRLE